MQSNTARHLRGWIELQDQVFEIQNEETNIENVSFVRVGDNFFLKNTDNHAPVFLNHRPTTEAILTNFDTIQFKNLAMVFRAAYLIESERDKISLRPTTTDYLRPIGEMTSPTTLFSFLQNSKPALFSVFAFCFFTGIALVSAQVAALTLLACTLTWLLWETVVAI